MFRADWAPMLRDADVGGAHHESPRLGNGRAASGDASHGSPSPVKESVDASSMWQVACTFRAQPRVVYLA